VLDPFEKVSGRGVKMLRDAGVEVEVGLLEDECRKINRRFMTAHSQGRPFIMLKWAQSADGFMSRVDGTPVALSNPLSRMMMHRERSLYDAIMVGTTTVITDNPRLTVRDWCGDSPRCVTFNQHGRLPVDSHIACGERSIILTECLPLEEQMRRLYKEHGVTSLMVEGGACLLQSFIDAGLYDDVRVETSTVVLGDGVKAPSLDCEKVLSQTIRGNEIHLKSS
jgi:diaminohydroxyphosphoribosylaminopyrimidine deaminase/5-amino-6-(5-phosphoribosylamino)uracil reductase